MENKLSVIVPVYNAERHLGRCVDSILSQSFSDFELILVDDGSSDTSYEMCLAYSQSDSRVRAIHKENGGANSARQGGVERSNAPWATFVDSDDIVPQGAFESLMAKSSASDTDLVVGFIADKPKYKDAITLREYRSLLIMQQYIHSGPVAKLYKRELLTADVFDIPRSISRGEDLIMNIRYAFKMSKAPAMVNKKVYNYIRRADSISFKSISSISFERELEFYRALTKYIPAEEQNLHLPDLVDYRISTMMIQLAMYPTDRGRAYREYYRALRSDMKKVNRSFTFDQRLVLMAKTRLMMRVVQKYLYTKQQWLAR